MYIFVSRYTSNFTMYVRTIVKAAVRITDFLDGPKTNLMTHTISTLIKQCTIPIPENVLY